MIRVVLLCALIMVGCSKGSVDVTELKIIGTPAIVIGKLLRMESGTASRSTCYLIVKYTQGKHVGKQEAVWADDMFYNHAKIGSIVYAGVNGGGTPMAIEFVEQ